MIDNTVHWRIEQRNALRIMMDHGHGARADKLTRDNCGACALAGRGARKGAAPNYAGWERVYVQAGCALPSKLAAIVRKAATVDSLYGKALAEDLRKHGLMVLDVVVARS